MDVQYSCTEYPTHNKKAANTFQMQNIPEACWAGAIETIPTNTKCLPSQLWPEQGTATDSEHIEMRRAIADVILGKKALAAPVLIGVESTWVTLWRITDDNLWRPTRRAKEHYTKDKLSTRRGPSTALVGYAASRVGGNTRFNIVSSK
ncbi:MAG TPA: hypothetical protein VGG19_18195 [Tepidisphaeraceae bacterium]|jgi:hypothetical protein